MTFTEKIKRNKNVYFYRAISIRKNDKVTKKRIYLGANLLKKELGELEEKADKELLKTRIEKNISALKSKILPILKKYKVKKAGIFGSYADGTEKKKSDVDILVEPPKNAGFDFIDIEEELKKALKSKIDLVTYKGLSPHLKKQILKQEVRVL